MYLSGAIISKLTLSRLEAAEVNFTTNLSWLVSSKVTQ